MNTGIPSVGLSCSLFLWVASPAVFAEDSVARSPLR